MRAGIEEDLDLGVPALISTAKLAGIEEDLDWGALIFTTKLCQNVGKEWKVKNA